MRRIKCSTDRGGLNITVYSIWHPDVEQHPDKRKAMSLAALEHSKQFSKEHYARNFFQAVAI